MGMSTDTLTDLNTGPTTAAAEREGRGEGWGIAPRPSSCSRSGC